MEWKTFGLFVFVIFTMSFIAILYSPDSTENYGVEMLCEEENGTIYTYGCIREGWIINGNDSLTDLGYGLSCDFVVCSDPESNYE